MSAKTPGQLAYEAEVAAAPTYFDGTPRPGWDALEPIVRWSWERAPTPRAFVIEAWKQRRAREEAASCAS